MSLNYRMRAFVEDYCRHFNATRAALTAKYSPKTAYSIGQENLKKPVIAAAIKARIEELTMSADEVKLGLADIARGDLADLMEITTAGYTFKLLIDGPDGQKIVNPKTKLIKKIKQKVTTYLAKQEDGEDREIIESEIELYSAHEAYRDIGKMHALFVDRTDITSNGKTIHVTVGGEDDSASD